MDYKKKYNEALEKARMYRDNAKAVEEYSAVARYENIFPELAENEDEELLNAIYNPSEFMQEAFDSVYEDLFRAKDSELKGWEYTIPEGMEATIKDGKVIVREKESEDERIRKAMMRGFNSMLANQAIGTFAGEPIKNILSYLEKQKEPNYTKRNALFDKCVENCNPEVMKRVSDEIDAELQKEQKPAEWSDNFEENIRNLLDDKLTWHSEDGSMSSTILIDDKTLKDIVRGIWFYVGKEALKYPSKELNVTEWSEEDEEMRDKITNHLCSFIYPNSLYGEDAKECIIWLKSLRPQPHWKPSKQEMDAFETALKGEFQNGYPASTLCELFEELKKLYYNDEIPTQ